MTERSKILKSGKWRDMGYGQRLDVSPKKDRARLSAVRAVTIQTSGVSCRMGVGGRRHRKRRRAEERKAGGLWVLYRPIVESKGDGFRAYEESRRRAEAELFRTLAGRW